MARTALEAKPRLGNILGGSRRVNAGSRASDSRRRSRTPVIKRERGVPELPARGYPGVAAAGPGLLRQIAPGLSAGVSSAGSSGPSPPVVRTPVEFSPMRSEEEDEDEEDLDEDDARLFALAAVPGRALPNATPRRDLSSDFAASGTHRLKVRACAFCGCTSDKREWFVVLTVRGEGNQLLQQPDGDLCMVHGSTCRVYPKLSEHQCLTKYSEDVEFKLEFNMVA